MLLSFSLLLSLQNMLFGDVLGDGRAHHIVVIVVLSDRAFLRPVLLIGSTGSLDFAAGALYLHLHEISIRRLLENMENGTFRPPDGLEALNARADGGRLPDGQIVEGLIQEEKWDCRQFCWIGAKPEMAAESDRPQICHLVNLETDEMDTFSPGLNQMETDIPAVDVSLSLYRCTRNGC